METIETNRLRLREWTFDDGPELLALAKDPNVGPKAGWKPHESLEESIQIINTVFFAGTTWKIIDKKSGKIIGCIGLEDDKKRPEIKSRELGYWLGRDFWNKGFMTEAAKAAIDYGFDKMELDIISVCTAPENKRSQKVIDKLGFSYEGTLRKAYRIYDGTDRDVLCYSITKEEWKNLQNNV